MPLPWGIPPTALPYSPKAWAKVIVENSNTPAIADKKGLSVLMANLVHQKAVKMVLR
jgi:hypothetical protein